MTTTPWTLCPKDAGKALFAVVRDQKFELKECECGSMESEFDEGIAERRKIIACYREFLEKWREPVGRESALPFPKSQIASAIRRELMSNPVCSERTDLDIAYAQLEFFIPDEEYRILSEFKDVDTRAQDLAATGEPDKIFAASRLFMKANGESAIRIQETISQKMQKRLEEIRNVRCGDR